MKLLIRCSFFLCLCLLTSCLGTSYLKDGEYLLHKQEIKGTEGLNKEELTSLYRQKPNNRFPIPFIWFYQTGEKFYDTTKVKQKMVRMNEKYDHKIQKNEQNQKKVKNLNSKKLAKQEKLNKVLEEGTLFMRWGEPLAVFDSTATAETKKQMIRYLHNNEYFNAKVTTEISQKRKKIKVVYKIEKGIPHKLNKITYTTKDTAIYRFIQKNSSQSLLKKDDNFEQNTFSRERDRLTVSLKNNGYFNFSKQYITYEVDSTIGNHKVNVDILISTPAEKDHHTVYYIDSVKFITDSNIAAPNTTRTKKIYNGIQYEYYRKRFSKRVLDGRLFIYPGDVYSRKNVFDTQRQLANLDIYRFVNIKNDTLGNKMVTHIFASPLKKFQTSNEIGLGVNVTEGFPGPFYNVSFKNRNLFGGLEILEFNGRIGIEGLPSREDVKEIYRGREISANFTLTFPQFIIPFNNRIRSKFGMFNPKTKITIGDIYINRPDYKRNNLNGSLAYSWSKRNTQFFFTLNEIALINSEISSLEFEEELEERKNQGSNLFRAFKPSFVSSMSLLTNINFNSYGIDNTKAAFLKIFLESGGTLYNLVDTTFINKILNNLEYYQYVKFNIDFRRTLPISKSNTIAYRLNLGIAKPYSIDKILPYEKYFFSGGSNGMRAWRPRRLGPGSYTPINSDTNLYDDRFEQSGEILLEASLELRRNLFGFVDGALFFDAGNIWTFENEEDRPGGSFDKDRFYKEIAVGAGLGLRFDFSFLVLRFDGAFKIYDPARNEGARFLLNKNFNDPVFENQKLFVVNIGIGYPF